MSDRTGGPSPIGHTLERFLRRSEIGRRVEEAAIVPEWSERVGATINNVTTPLRVSNGVLFIAVRSSPWLMELKLMEAEIVRRLNEGRERGRIEKIRFVLAEE